MRHNNGSNASSPDVRVKPADIKSKRDGDWVTVAVAGRVDLSTADRLDTTIRDAEKTQISRIVVDLTSVSFIDSTALGVLLEATKRNRRRGRNRLTFVPSKHEWVTRLLRPDRHHRDVRVSPSTPKQLANELGQGLHGL